MEKLERWVMWDCLGQGKEKGYLMGVKEMKGGYWVVEEVVVN